MMISKTTLLARVPLLGALMLGLLSFQESQAAAPDGAFAYGPFNQPAQAIWDLTGVYSIEQEILTEDFGYVDLVLTFFVVQDAKGKASGSGSTMIQMVQGNTVLEQSRGTYTVKGKVKSANGVTAADVAVKVTGEDVIFNGFRKFNITIRYKMVVDSQAGRLIGMSKGKASAAGVGAAPIDDAAFHPLPAGMDGSWTLTMNIQDDGKKLGGTANARLSNGLDVPLGLKGKYSAKTDQSKIQLFGEDAFKGTKFKILLQGGSAIIVDWNAKVLGQKL